jgi:hypothetical protein
VFLKNPILACQQIADFFCLLRPKLVKMSAVDLKNQGNRLFAARKYEDAVSCYSKAIVSFAWQIIDSVKK